MANLGSIGVCRTIKVIRPLPVWAGGSAAPARLSRTPYAMKIGAWWRLEQNNSIINSLLNASLSGQVSQNSSPLAFAIIRLYYRVNGVFIRGTRSDAAGNFVISGLEGADSGNYVLVALDQDANFNAVVYDRLTAL